MTPPAVVLRERLASVDTARGLVMVLMALDHVRVFAGVPAGGATPGVFFTRWITHPPRDGVGRESLPNPGRCVAGP